jgi:hypothetical protein
MSRGRFLLLALGLVPVAWGCNSSSPGSGASGIQGVCTQTIHPGPADSKPQGPTSLPNAKIVVLAAEGDRAVAQAVTDNQGRFRIELKPGRYRVQAPEGLEKTVEVPEGRFVVIDLDVVIALPSPAR